MNIVRPVCSLRPVFSCSFVLMIAAGLFAKTLRRRKTANLPAGLALQKLREGDAGRSVFIRVNL